MNWFKKNLKPSWIFRSEFKIWRLLPAGRVLAAELRDTEKKTTEFAGIDLNTGALLWKGNPLNDKWWITVNKINKDVLFLQQFARPDMPTPGKIFALDLRTGKLLWQNQELSFINISRESIFGLLKTFKSEEVVELNYKTGEEKKRLSVDDLRIPEIINEENEYVHDATANEFFVPDLIEEFDEKTNLKKSIPSRAINPAIIKLSNKEIVGYHLDAGKDEKGIPVYDAYVMIVDAGGKIFEDVADRKVHSAIQDFFFVVSEKLIYVKNSSEIVAVAL